MKTSNTHFVQCVHLSPPLSSSVVLGALPSLSSGSSGEQLSWTRLIAFPPRLVPLQVERVGQERAGPASHGYPRPVTARGPSLTVFPVNQPPVSRPVARAPRPRCVCKLSGDFFPLRSRDPVQPSLYLRCQCNTVFWACCSEGGDAKHLADIRSKPTEIDRFS